MYVTLSRGSAPRAEAFADNATLVIYSRSRYRMLVFIPRSVPD